MFESNKVSLNPSFILLPNNIYTEQFWVKEGEQYILWHWKTMEVI